MNRWRGGIYAGCDNERALGSGGSLRTPDQALEPEDEEVSLRGAERHLYHRPPEDHGEVQRGVPVRRGTRRARRFGALCGDQAAGGGFCQRRGGTERDVLRASSLARRDLDEFPDHPEEHQPAQATGADAVGWQRREPPEKGGAASRPRDRKVEPDAGGDQGNESAARGRRGRRYQAGAGAPPGGPTPWYPRGGPGGHPLGSGGGLLSDPGQ